MAIEEIEITQAYSPKLSNEYSERLRRLAKRLDEVFPSYKAQLIDKEITLAGELVNENDIEGFKYIIALRVLTDLLQQGWSLEIRNGYEIYLTMLTENSNDKAYVRNRLSAERRAQFRVESIQRFIREMEQPRIHNNREVSIRDLDLLVK